MLSPIDRDGFVIVPDILSTEAVRDLLLALQAEPDSGDASASRRGESVYAVRNVLSASASAREVARSAAIRALVEPVLGPGCVAVRGILFDKTPSANWNVVWHQDLSLAVRERVDIDGLGPWSVKAGIAHVQPPAEVLEKMLTVRLHLDTCHETNGPLRVLPGTQTMGRLSPVRIAELRREIPERVCTVNAGGVLLMRPLLLHASSDATAPEHRRVLHIEFAAGFLPCPLEWYDSLGAIREDSCAAGSQASELTAGA